MSRLLLTCLSAFIWGAASWAVFGFLSAYLFTKAPGGAREGAGAMAGFFFVGSIFGILGLALGAWITWRVLANPERTGAVSLSLAAVVAILVIGITVAMQPRVVTPDDYPGRKAEFVVEVSFPNAELDKNDRLSFEMRSAEGTEVTGADRSQQRLEGGRAILPGTFRIRSAPRSKLLAVMKNDHQWMCATLNVEGPVDGPTDWSAWQPMEEGLKARWRLVLHER